MDTTKTKVPVFPILLINFISTLGYSIILPFLVILVLKLGGNELSYGFLGATYSAFQFVGAPILGNWSDKFGRKKILLLSEAGTFAGWLLFLIAIYLPAKQLAIHSGFLKIFLNTVPLFLLFISRAIDGLTGGNISVANAYLADISAKEDRKKNFGKISASANLGFIIGPALAGVLGATALGVSLPVIAALLVSLAGLFAIAFSLKDIKPHAVGAAVNEIAVNKVLGQESKDCYTAETPEKTSFFTVLKLPNVSYFLVLYFLIFLGFNFFYVSFPVYVVQQLKWNLFQLGIFFAVLSGILVIVQGPILSRLSSLISASKMIIAGNLMLTVAFTLFCSKSMLLIYIGVLFFSFGNGIMWPSFLALLSNVAGNRYQGAVQGFAGSAGSIASIIGLITGAFIYRIFGASIFLLAAAFMVIIAISAYRLVSIEKNSGNN
jgi:DHA1 family tetracycline resistance protein-like MFS transporter